MKYYFGFHSWEKPQRSLHVSLKNNHDLRYIFSIYFLNFNFLSSTSAFNFIIKPKSLCFGKVKSVGCIYFFFFWHYQCFAHALEIIYFTVILKQNKVGWKTNPLVTTDLSILLIEYSTKLQFWSELDSNVCQKNGRNVFLQSFSKACLAKGEQQGQNSHIFISLHFFWPQHLSPHFNRWHFKKLPDTFYHIFLCLTVACALETCEMITGTLIILTMAINLQIMGFLSWCFNATLNDNLFFLLLHVIPLE